MSLCECGCGCLIKDGNRFVLGHNAMVGHLVEISKSKKGKTYSEVYGERKAVEIRSKIGVGNRGKRLGIRNETVGRKISDSLKRLYRLGYVSPLKGRKQSIETVNRRFAKILSVVCQRPNNFEKRWGEDLEKRFPGKFKYVGNGSVMIGGKSPDYVSEELKIVVLCNGLYWHLWRVGLTDSLEDKRKVELKESEPFRQAGYEVWFIWEGIR